MAQSNKAHSTQDIQLIIIIIRPSSFTLQLARILTIDKRAEELSEVGKWMGSSHFFPLFGNFFKNFWRLFKQFLETFQIL